MRRLRFKPAAYKNQWTADFDCPTGQVVLTHVTGGKTSGPYEWEIEVSTNTGPVRLHYYRTKREAKKGARAIVKGLKR